MNCELVVIGASWGGLRAFKRLLAGLPDELAAPVVLVQHRSPDSHGGALQQLLGAHTKRPVDEAADKNPIEPGHVYVAPPDYHLLVERESFALTLDERVQHARPSIDVLFESAADAYGDAVVGVVLTGASADGAAGLRRIKQRGGLALVQDPAEAEQPTMPRAALAATPVDAVLGLDEIGPYLRARLSEPVIAGGSA